MKFLALFLALIASVFGAEYAIPSSRLPAAGTWESSGVPGYDWADAVPNYVSSRTTVYTTITSTGDTTDRTADINGAIAACPSGQVVMLGPGTFTCNGTITIGFTTPNITLRGSVNVDGSPASLIDTRNASVGVQIGTEFAFNYPSGGVDATVASLTKGATSITVADTSYFGVGQLLRIIPAIESTTPVIKVYGTQPFYPPRAQIVRVAGIPNGTTLTIEAPGLHGDFTLSASAKVYTSQFSTRSVGLENIHVDGSLASPQPFSNIQMSSAYGCWVYNCKSTGANNYQATAFYSFKSEMRRVWTEGLDSGSSTVNFLISNSCSFSVVDCVVLDAPYAIFQQDLCSGNVFSYNLIVNSTSSVVNPGYSNTSSNHGPWNQFTLFEGNAGSYYQNDGYFGGTGYSTLFRNWWMGRALNFGDSAFSVSINRLSRYENVVGNVLGRTGIGGGGISMGNPNLGNGYSYGVASMGGAASVLTTRTDATTGTITAPSGHGVTTGSTIDVYWRDSYGTDLYVSKIRYGVTVGTVVGTLIPISGGVGDDLPSSSAEIFVPTTNDTLWSYSLDWNQTTQSVHEWTGTLTTRTSDTAGVVTLDPGQMTTFNAALANASGNGRGLTTSTTQIGFLIVTNVTGDVVTFDTASATLPALSSSVRLVPCPYGFEEFDLDVVRTTLPKENYYGLASGSGIPSAQSIGSDALASSMFISSTPAFFTESSISWPSIDPGSPVTNTYNIIPAGKAYNDGWWPGGGSTPSTATVTNLNVGTIRLAP